VLALASADYLGELAFGVRIKCCAAERGLKRQLSLGSSQPEDTAHIGAQYAAAQTGSRMSTMDWERAAENVQ
jgi:hypothetical protein